jgi:hypothetical protein
MRQKSQYFAAATGTPLVSSTNIPKLRQVFRFFANSPPPTSGLVIVTSVKAL